MSQHKALYNTAAWKRKRLAQLAAQPLCAMCEAQGRVTAATIADHVVPHRGCLVLFYHGLLQSLCKRCHDGAKQQQELRGQLRGGDLNGYPMDASHHWAQPRGAGTTQNEIE